MAVLSAKEVLWKERLAQWYMSGLSQRAYAAKVGLHPRQMSYWAQRLQPSRDASTWLPVKVIPTLGEAPASNETPSIIAEVSTAHSPTSTITLRSEHGWALTFPSDVPAAWLAELMRGL
jgi:hypothetical protein